ncbi:MAG: hypothetical protein ACPGSC_00735 [Granulosicoccaceae bacterium]
MSTFKISLSVPVLSLLPVVGWSADFNGLMAGHWDSVALIALGVGIVWYEINVASRRQAKHRRENAWGALRTWRKPERARSGWMPVLAKLVTRRSRR